MAKKATSSRKTLDQICNDINKKFQQTIVNRGLGIVDTQRIPFTSPRLNYMTYGGLPRGRFIEFLGEEGSGKTTTALDIAGQAQKVFQQEWEDGTYPGDEPQKVVYVDVETTLDREWARKLGVDVESLYIVQPLSQSAEDIFDAVIAMLETGEVGLVVIDSLAAMVSFQELEKDVGEASYAGISKALTLFTKKSAPLCHNLKSSVIGINQLRDDLKNPYNVYKTPGGRAWKFGCAVRMAFQKGHFVDEAGDKLTQGAENPAGNKVEVSIIKTKAFPPDRRLGFYTLTYDFGIDDILDLVDTGIKYGVIKYGAGGWTTFLEYGTGEPLMEEDGTPIKVQGRTNIAEFLRDDDFVLTFVKEQISKADQS